ncbi:MAG: diguanylate cyclase [Lysobacterales bacterium]
MDANNASNLLEQATTAFDKARFTHAAACARQILSLSDVPPESAAGALAIEGAALVQLGLYRDGLDALRLSNNLHIEHDLRDATGFAHNYLGNAHEELGDLQQAYLHYDQALALADHVADRSLRARVLANMGAAMAGERRFDVAMNHLHRAAAEADSIHHSSLQGWIEGVKARVIAAKGDTEAAGECFARAIELCHQASETRAEGEILLHFSAYLEELGHGSQALENLRSALRIFRSVNARWGIARAYDRLATLAETMGDPATALAHFREYHQLRVEMLKEMAKARIQSMTNQRDLELAQMERAVSHLRNVELAEALEEVEAQKTELERLSIRDPLTGTYNRRYLDSALDKAFHFANRHNNLLAIAVIDLDHFKQVNDQYSHAVGDQVLIRFVELLNDNLRAEDVLARFGGEEFVLVMAGVDLAAGAAACQKLCHRVTEFDWSTVQDGLSLTISIGLADNVGASTWAEIMSNADRRLYKAKDAGRNRVKPSLDQLT